jgi:hypothetical protein
VTNDRKILLMLLLRVRKARKDLLRIEALDISHVDEIAYAYAIEKMNEAFWAALNAKKIICDVYKND